MPAAASTLPAAVNSSEPSKPAATPAKSSTPASAKPISKSPTPSTPASPLSISNPKRRSKTSTASPPAIGKTAVGAIRINPDVDAKTHTKTTTGRKGDKFGVDIERAERVFEQYRKLKNLRIAGVHIHIGSPVYQIQPYIDAVTKMIALIDRLTERGHRIEWFDLGGGFAVNYERPDQALPITEHAKALIPLLRDKPYRIALEPGRYIAGNSGILLARVLYRKQSGDKKFVIVDAGMNDLIRPTLYESYHHIWPVKPDPANVPASETKPSNPATAKPSTS